jgi:NADH-quinone oxidoreductase subunit E
MLSEAERAEIDAEAAHYPQRRAVAIDALRIVQRHRGYISDAALGEVAAHLELTAAELEGVATFYNLLHRRPVGRHVVWLCDGVSCWLCGGARLRRALEGALGIGLGETTADGRFTLLPIVCLGACDRAPVAMVDEDLHRDLDPGRDPARAAALLEAYR